MPRTNQNNSQVRFPSKNASASCSICSEQRLSVVSIVCRICYDNEKDEPLITPCRCKGTVAFVHRSCLETWLAESNTSTCELCHQIFKTERTPKYTSRKSICKWLKMPAGHPRQRGAKGDLLACGLLTPVAIIITYICLFSADYYNQKKFTTIPAARWTSLSLLFMTAVMLIGYYLWVYSVIRVHARMWYNWWQRECVVKYVPPSIVNISSACPSSVHTPNNTPLSVTSLTEINERELANIRGDSRYQIGSKEDVYHEALNRVNDKKIAKPPSAVSNDTVIEIDHNATDNERLQTTPVKSESSCYRTASSPIKLIKNQGYVYIINIKEPKIDVSSDSKIMAHPACLEVPPSTYSDESKRSHISHSQFKFGMPSGSHRSCSGLRNPSNETCIEVETDNVESRVEEPVSSSDGEETTYL